MILMKKIITLIFAALMVAVTTSAADQLAFPGAYGWGRFAKGARASSAPTVYHVTNLNDSGTGSLRDAVSQSNRIVVFDVSGVIKISSRIVFKSNLYIAGQTAPGEGITVYGNGVSFSGASNIICRYLRVRMGHGGDSGKDCAGISNGTNMIFDHCSFSWGLDETFSINPDGRGDLGNITLQNCIFGQGLLTHSAGGLMQADYITLYRNFYCDNSTRNNKIKGINQYANNVVYNWQNGCYIMGGDSEGTSYVNIESNLFINGPAKGGNCFGGANANFNCYGDDNWQDSNMNGFFDPYLVTDYSAATRVDKPYDYPELDLYPGDKLLELNIPTVGASLPYRDQSDCYMVDEVMSYGKEGKLITYETSLPIGAPDTWAWWAGSKVQDTDGDGMPDAWEKANGTDPNKADATVLAANGYLNIENYINSITADDRQFFLRAPITLSLANATTSTLTLQWRDYTYAEEGFAVEVEQEDGSWKEVARTPANATSCEVSGLEQATQYRIRVCAFAKNNGSEAKSAYSSGTFTTRQIEAGIVDIDSFTPDVTLGDAQTAWDMVTTDWKEGKAYADGNKVLLNTDADKTVTIAEKVNPEAVVVNGEGTLTLTGVIGGEATTVNKGNSGTLVLNGQNTYTGATVLHGGVIEFNSIANGGVASAIGASLEFPANWVMDGGTYRYTGASASTNRGAKLMRGTTLEIANSGTTLTANGSFEGEGDFILDGKGTLAVANTANFFKYNGATVLSGGTLSLTDIENACKPFGATTNPVIFNGGAIKFAYKNEDSQTYSFPIQVNEGTYSKFYAPSHGDFKSSMTGSGTLEMIIPYLRFSISGTLPGFTGRIVANGVPYTGTQTIFYHGSQWNSPQVTFTLKGKAYMTAWTTNAVNVIGGLSGDAGTYLIGSSKKTKGFKCSWEVGGANTDETFKGIINNLPLGLNSSYSGTVSIKKVGTGLWRLTGANSYSGTTQVAGGTLIVNGTHSGTGAVTVMSGATLKGMGKIAGKVTLFNGATVEGGDTLVNGKGLVFSSTLTLSNGSTVNMPVSLTKCNTITLNGAATIGETAVLNITVSEDGLARAPYADTEYQVFKLGTNGSITGQFASISDEVLTEGQSWDTTDLYTKGILRVKGGDIKPDEPIEPEDPDEPAGETMRVTLAYGNMTPKSYDDSGINNMLVGAENKETNGITNNNLGFSIVYTEKLEKTLDKGSKMTYTFDGTQRTNIKLSNGAQVTVNLPENARATKLEIWSVVGTNSSNRTSYWKEVCGKTFTEADATILDITAGKVNCVTFDLPNVDVITFTNTGEQQCVILNIDYHYGGPTGIDEKGVNASLEDGNGNSAIYNVAGQRVNDAYRGYVVKQNKKYIK